MDKPVTVTFFSGRAQLAGGHEEIIEFLLESGADPNAKDGKGKTAKSVASRKGYDDAARVLKKAIKEKIIAAEDSESESE